MHGLRIVQYDSFYRIFTPTGVEIGQVFLPPDGHLSVSRKNLADTRFDKALNRPGVGRRSSSPLSGAADRLFVFIGRFAAIYITQIRLFLAVSPLAAVMTSAL